MAKPFNYQRKDARTTHRLGGRVLLAHDPGCGKTLISLLYATKHEELRPIVVVCPASLKWQWQHEAAKHFGIRAEVLETTTPLPINTLTKPTTAIINYDILTPWLGYLRALHPKLVIIDECSYLADRKTKRTKAVGELCRGVEKVLCLSGTPLTNRPAELWPTLNLLRPDLFPSFYQFAMRYCAPKKVPWGTGWDLRGASRLPELHQKLSETLMIRRRKVDILHELPEKQRVVIPVDITEPGEYVHAQRDFITWLAQQDKSKARKAERAQKLVQLGYLKRLAAKLKLPAVLQWVDGFLKESEEKLVLFAVHKDIIDQLEKRYRKICVVVDGEVTGRARQEAVNQFQKNPKTRVFIGNIKAAGVGLNLTAASTVAFAEMDWTPGGHTQAEDRVHRIGQQGSALAVYLVARGTIEERLVGLIQQKQKVLSSVLDGGKGDDLDILDQLAAELLREKSP